MYFVPGAKLPLEMNELNGAGYSPSFYLDIKLRPFLVLFLLQFGICVPVNCNLLHNFFATFRLITSVTTGAPILEG
jgi:hypothetical protein